MNGSRRALLEDAALIAALALVALALALWLRTGAGASRGAGNQTAFRVPHPAVTVTELRALRENRRVLIIDGRTRASYERGHIPGAVSLDVNGFDGLIGGFKAAYPDRERLLVVYCDNRFCGTADELQQRLVDQGYAHVGICRDGWEGWSRQGPGSQ